MRLEKNCTEASSSPVSSAIPLLSNRGKESHRNTLTGNNSPGKMSGQSKMKCT